VPKYVDCGRHLIFRSRQARPGGCGGRTRVSHGTGGYSCKYEAPYLRRGGRLQKTPTDTVPKYVDCGRHLPFRTRQARPGGCGGRTRVSHRTGGYSRKYEAPYFGRAGRVQKMPTGNVPKYVDCGRHLTFRTRQARPGMCGGRTRVSHRTGGYSRKYETPFLGCGGRVQRTPTDNVPKYVDCGRHLPFRTRQARPGGCGGRTRVSHRTGGYSHKYEAPYFGRAGRVQKMPTGNVPKYVDCGRHLTFRTRQARPGMCGGRTRVSHRTGGYSRKYETPFLGCGGRVQRTPTDNVPKYVDCGRHLIFRTRQARPGGCGGRTRVSYRTGAYSRKYEAHNLGRGGRVQKTPTDNVPKYVDCGRHLTFRTRQARPGGCGGRTRVSHRTGRYSRKYEAPYLGRGGRVQKTPTDNVPKYVDCGRHLTFRTRQARPGGCGGRTRVSHRTGGYSRKYEAPYLGSGGRVQKTPTNKVPKYVDCGRHLTFRTRQARSGGCGGRTRVSYRTGGYSRMYETSYLGRGGRFQKTPTDNVPKYVDCGRHLIFRTRQARPGGCGGRTRVSHRTGGCSRKYEAPYLGRGGRVKKTPTDNVPKYVDCGRHLTFRTRQARPGGCGGRTRVSHRTGG